MNDATIKEDEDVIIVDWSTITFLPSRRYIQKLLQLYIIKLEECNIELQDDNLASLVCYFSMTKCSALPDPTSCSLVTFRIPKSNNSMESNDNDTSPSTNNTGNDDDDIIQINSAYSWSPAEKDELKWKTIPRATAIKVYQKYSNIGLYILHRNL